MSQGLSAIVEVAFQGCHMRITAEPVLADIVSFDGVVNIAGAPRVILVADACLELCWQLFPLSKTNTFTMYLVVQGLDCNRLFELSWRRLGIFRRCVKEGRTISHDWVRLVGQ